VRTVISNASPLITLAKADLLELLPGQFSEVIIPQAVVDEILQGPDDDPMRRMVNKLPWLKQISLEPALTPLAYWQLGRGEGGQALEGDLCLRSGSRGNSALHSREPPPLRHSQLRGAFGRDRG